jgi:hypothetical protein
MKKNSPSFSVRKDLLLELRNKDIELCRSQLNARLMEKIPAWFCHTRLFFHLEFANKSSVAIW